MIAQQLSLPGIDMRPICPACKRPSALLAQWSPGDTVYVCRQCYAKYPPPDVFVHHDNSRGVGLKQGDDVQTCRDRERYHDLVNSLDRMRRGCVYSMRDHEAGRGIPCERGGHQGYRNCPLCVRRARRLPRYGGLKASLARFDQISLPICQRCGCIHDNRYNHIDDYEACCQQCSDEKSVEAFWTHKGIFGGDDDEAIMDRIQKSHPGLFKRGVLPDYWFQLKLKEVTTQ